MSTPSDRPDDPTRTSGSGDGSYDPYQQPPLTGDADVRDGDPATTPVVTDLDGSRGDRVGDDEDDAAALVTIEERSAGGSAGPGLAIAGLLAGLVALLTAATESAVRECVPDVVGVEATGVDGFLTALLLAVVAVVLSAVGVVMSRTERWGAAVGIAGVVVGVLVVVLWLLSVWVLSADVLDLATITTQEATLPLQGVGCA